MKTEIVTTVVRNLVAGVLTLSAAGAWAGTPEIKNVIVLMMDGTASSHTTISRWYKGAPLATDRMLVAGLRTFSADSLITDSAPAATAFATGYKTNDKFVGVLPDKVTMPGVAVPASGQRYKPVASVLEGARIKGKAVGLVATSNVQHASPAGYSAHWPARGNYPEIAEQQVYQNIDVMLGGGRKYLLPTTEGGVRTDGENLIAVLRAKGYDVVGTRNEMVASRAGKLWGLFAADDMSYELDRQALTPDQPALAEMTQKAIDVLSRNKKGFFLFVEGSKVDWAAHANDPIGVIGDVLAFDAAVDTALQFSKRNAKTLVLVFSDHGNGGMTIGNRATDKTYTTLSAEKLVDPLKKATLTGEGLDKMLAAGGERSVDTVRTLVARHYGINDLSEAEVNAVVNAPAGTLSAVVGPMISARSVIGWSTGGHTGEDLFFYFSGLSKPLGMIDNTDIAHLSSQHLGFELAAVDRQLFVEAESAFGAIGAAVLIDRTDPANLVLRVAKGKTSAVLPFSKNLMRLSGKKGESVIELEGLTVFAPNTEKVYVPRQAVARFAAAEK